MSHSSVKKRDPFLSNQLHRPLELCGQTGISVKVELKVKRTYRKSLFSLSQHSVSYILPAPLFFFFWMCKLCPQLVQVTEAFIFQIVWQNQASRRDLALNLSGFSLQHYSCYQTSVKGETISQITWQHKAVFHQRTLYISTFLHQESIH